MKRFTVLVPPHGEDFLFTSTQLNLLRGKKLKLGEKRKNPIHLDKSISTKKNGTSVTRFGNLFYFEQRFKAFGNNQLPKSPTFLSIFCKGAKIIHFSNEIIFGQLLYRHWQFLYGHTDRDRILSMSFGPQRTAFISILATGDPNKTKTFSKKSDHLCNF